MPMTGNSDTSTDAQRVREELLRRTTPAERFAMCCRLTAEVRALSRRALSRARPDLRPADLSIEWISIHYGSDIAEGVRRRLRESQ
jgi:hypothetical protein